jgi:hypothetical protein
MRLLISTILAIIILSFLFGCGTRKTNTQQRDSIHIENNYSTGTKIILGNTFTYRPFDALKPMKIDSKTYENVIISNDKSITKIEWKNRNITKTITIEKVKATKKTDYSNLYIGLFLLLVLGVLAWFKLPSFRKGI